MSSKRIRPRSSDDGFIPANFGGGGVLTGSDYGNIHDRMIVPDRIVVTGGNSVIADKAAPREIALDMYTFAPGPGYRNSLLETPPDKLTLRDREFPAANEDELIRRQHVSITDGDDHNNDHEQSGPDGHEKDGDGAGRKHHSYDSLPSTATMSLLSPSEELVLMRKHVRKLTTRLQKLEEELQDTNRHVVFIELLGGIGMLAAVIVAIGAMRRL